MSDKSAVKALQDIGLTEYEAKVYTALAKIKTGIASEIHMISGIPRSAVYGALAKLENRGIVEVQHSKPMRYKVVSPAKSLEKLRSSFLHQASNALDALEEVYQAEEIDDKSEENIWMSRGGKNVYEKVLELVRSANREICIVAYSVITKLEKKYRIFKDVGPALADAIESGVNVKILCANDDECQQVRENIPGAEARVCPMNKEGSSLLAVSEKYSMMVVCSGTNAGQITTIWSDGYSIVSMFQQFAEAMWQFQSNEMNG
jgi:sugar-specific transcriptional regulator TrmB